MWSTRKDPDVLYSNQHEAIEASFRKHAHKTMRRVLEISLIQHVNRGGCIDRVHTRVWIKKVGGSWALVKQMPKSTVETCKRKKKYLLPGYAHRVASRIMRKQGVDVRHYKCPYCGFYHVGGMDGCH